MSKEESHCLQTLKAAVKILSYQYNSHQRYTNSVLGNHQSSVTNSSSQHCILIFISSATTWTSAQFDATQAQNISKDGDYRIIYQAEDDELTIVVL